MASTYVNHLRLEEITDGEQAGTWGATTNTNLELIGQAFAWGTRAIANASTDNITIADGAADADRSLALKLTGGGQACTVTLLPNTSSKVWIMNNATSYTLTFTAGSGANVAIVAGETKVIATDGLGSGGVVYDLFTNLTFNDLTVSDDLILNSDSALISLGAGADATLTHDGTTGLTIAATPISIDATGELHLNSTTGDIKLQDGGVDQITFDLDGTAGEVIMKPAVDADDLVIAQFDGTEVIRIEDNASLGLVGNKLNIANSSSDVVIKPLTDAKDIIFQQFDGTAVMTVEDNVSLTINNDATVAGRATSSTYTALNMLLSNGSNDEVNLALGNNFIATTTAGSTVFTFENPIIGQSGTIMFVNAGNHSVSMHASVNISAASLAVLQVTGTYMVSYFCSAASGNDTIFLSVSQALV